MSEFSGARLKQVRESKHISLEQVAKETRIQLSILKDLEDEEYAELSSPTQVKGFIRVYSSYLGVDLSKQITPTLAAQTPGEGNTSTNQLTVQDPEPEPSLTGSNNKIQNKIKNSVRGLGTHESTPEPNTGTRSQQILRDIGNDLTARRRYLNLPWEVIVEQTHTQKKQLQALERGQINELNSPMQARGLLQNYAKFLNLDVDLISLRFADALQERRLEASKPDRKQRKSVSRVSPILFTIKRFFTLDLFFGSMLVLGILAFLVWGMARMANQQHKEPSNSSVPAMINVILATPTESTLIEDISTAEGITSIQLPTITPLYTPIESDALLQLVVISRQNVWVRVSQDGEIAFTGRLLPGTATSFEADEIIELETGNAAGLEFVLNNDPEEHSSQIGTAALFIFNAQGMSVSSILVTPIPSPTPTR